MSISPRWGTKMPERDPFDIAELERRLANLIRDGLIASVDYDAARARVQIGDLLTAPLPWYAGRAGGDRTWWAPEVGEQVTVLSPSGELAQGRILPALYSNAAPAPASAGDVSRAVWADGLVVEHDRARKLTRIHAPEGTLVLDAKNVVIRTGEGGYYQLDNAGRVSRITHVDGAEFKSESWTTGAVVTAEPDQGYSPPAVLTPEEES
jgi:phage baseplate assembly protein V